MAEAQGEVDAHERDEKANTRRETRPLHRPLFSRLLHAVLGVQVLHTLHGRRQCPAASLTATHPLLRTFTRRLTQPFRRYSQSALLHSAHRTLLLDILQTSTTTFETVWTCLIGCRLERWQEDKQDSGPLDDDCQEHRNELFVALD